MEVASAHDARRRGDVTPRTSRGGRRTSAYFCQADFFGALTGLKSLPPAAMPSPLHFSDTDTLFVPARAGDREEIVCRRRFATSQAERTPPMVR